MRIVFHHIHHLGPAMQHALDKTLETIMAVSAEVQNVLDKVNQLTSVREAIDTGFAGLNQQITDLKNQIANQTPSLSAEDKQALVGAAESIGETVTRLQSDIPANSDAPPAPGTSPAA